MVLAAHHADRHVAVGQRVESQHDFARIAAGNHRSLLTADGVEHHMTVLRPCHAELLLAHIEAATAQELAHMMAALHFNPCSAATVNAFSTVLSFRHHRYMCASARERRT